MQLFIRLYLHYTAFREDCNAKLLETGNCNFHVKFMQFPVTSPQHFPKAGEDCQKFFLTFLEKGLVFPEDCAIIHLGTGEPCFPSLKKRSPCFVRGRGYNVKPTHYQRGLVSGSGAHASCFLASSGLVMFSGVFPPGIQVFTKSPATARRGFFFVRPKFPAPF